METVMNRSTLRRLADASHNKIYPSIIPRNELPLRKILLTTRFWNDVRHLQEKQTTTNIADDWLFSQQDTFDQFMFGQQSTKDEETVDITTVAETMIADALPTTTESTEIIAIPISDQSTDRAIKANTLPCDWSWFDETKSSLLDSFSHEIVTEDTQLLLNNFKINNLLSHQSVEPEDRKRARGEQEEEDRKKRKVEKEEIGEDCYSAIGVSITHHTIHFPMDAPATPAGPASGTSPTPSSPPVLLSA
ncbi:hypothetical protein BDB01DRAFT_780906 [Pilobolus umbonatus]|nr:hypothetical protein BDB01DRAFT_780906 [Pilobolus umbonatus]